jgi:hypothetical protein
MAQIGTPKSLLVHGARTAAGAGAATNILQKQGARRFTPTMTGWAAIAPDERMSSSTPM